MDKDKHGSIDKQNLASSDTTTQVAPQPTAKAGVPESNETEVKVKNYPTDIKSDFTKYYPKSGFGNKKIIKLMLGILGLLVFFLIVALGIAYFRNKPVSIFGNKGEIVWWNIWLDAKVVEPLIQEYEEQNPQVTIKYIKQSPQDYKDRLANALLKGNGPDIFSIHNSWPKTMTADLDIVPSSFMASKDYTSTYYPVIVNDLKTSTGFVAVPLYYDAITLFINDDIFATAGKTAPRTWDQLKQVARDLTFVGNEKLIIQSGIALGRTDNIDYWQEIVALLMLQNGVDLTSPTGQPAIEALDFYTAFASKKDPTWEAALPPSTEAFAQGKVAMFIGPSSAANDITKINPNLNFRTTILPQIRRDDPSQLDISYSTYWAEAVAVKSTNRDISWSFLKFLSRPENLKKMSDNLKTANTSGLASPRIDMNELHIRDSVLGSIIALAPNAKSWYLADRTYDGVNGINSQMATPFEKAINTLNLGGSALNVVKGVSDGVTQVLAKFVLN